MISASWDRARQLRTAARILAVLAAAARVPGLSVALSLPETWWPRAGQACASDTGPVHAAPCALIVGPAKAYSRRDAMNSASLAPRHTAGAAWRLVPTGAGLAVLAMGRRRSAAGQRRR
ncbi:hypothetical protein [Streptomyces sp. NBC_00568]|uniref:hypothetical protein n=1 Tax=Streptomyces sp. NBC_00568 TaxID=2975779 RepID=UPI00224FB7B8|nr:hypothetical protein [Streptomyces sp. NBC_00568]MCX4993355.1 hypothetical protein [Streptomyces sp. NBC_00568]